MIEIGNVEEYMKQPRSKICLKLVGALKNASIFGSLKEMRNNEMTNVTSLNHSMMDTDTKLSNVPFNRVGDAKSTVQVYKFSLSVNMTYASIGSRYV